MIDITSSQFIIGWILFAVVLCPLQFIVAAPYGRHTKQSWGPVMNSKLGWVIMELVALLAFLVSFLTGTDHSAVTVFIALLFTIHYVHRSLVYPFMTKSGKKTMPIIIVLFAIVFNIVNGYINGDYLGANPEVYHSGYFTQWNFVAGLGLFIGGAILNVTSDYYLISLRRSTEQGSYQIPRKRAFNKVSCPNLLGEIIEWSGFALLCWSLPALAFAIWTMSNLIPRAWQHHKWYKSKFPDYPEQRYALFPGVM